ncbi:tubulin folding cofactor D C terminal-domain-containing protein [Staphylotrichum tortipilum]|uniref:Tubulin folding cofactor D C terminal-domain-containing protein n=1 Tax=Staphylotrichum tortipilum TaxID=2831512 RepID=A0AAN6RS84_9PEZI|nr:tubulin folding cofactor D C terminal-domain-containing protein [Staphylotrichum longicolle]
MDAPEEDLDIKLQKISGDLIAEFDKSLRVFLRKPARDGASASLPPVRSRVRTRETDRLISTLLDPFQELPQLLDPHLPLWLPALSDAFLESVQQQSHPRSHHPAPASDVLDSSGGNGTRAALLTPLPRAICRLLYTLCKIRGEKVVVRFLANEAKYLEVLLTALERAERESREGKGGWTWEERYVVLLWLGYLLLAPFDLASISSGTVGDGLDGGEEGGSTGMGGLEGFLEAGKLPGIAVRVLPIAVKYLAAPGKERDAARAVLVRIAMRGDMQRLGVLDGLVRWALEALKPAADGQERTPYHYIGVLGFLAGVLGASADTSDMDGYLGRVFGVVHGIAAEGGGQAGSMMASALARKTVIKVIRAIAVLALRNPEDEQGMEMVETTIGFLLECLADNDTPVRFAASKALSIITLRLDTDMASQVVEAVLDSLNKNVLHVKDPRQPTAPPKKDLSMVDPLEWHGLMLTLAHLLYRRSPPAENLADIVHALLMGLSYERRSTSGSSTGANVRDAACFGVWALARRYTTQELLAVPTEAVSPSGGSSILQIIATELVVAACLDTSGNIRRGSSAALQELIGRHSDTVEQGIWVVQTVDYHAVALRSRALRDVALGVTKLSGLYGEAILDALLGWRGVGDADTAARRAAGMSYGAVTAQLASTEADPMQRLAQSVSLVLERIKTLEARQVEERHGLYFSFAAVLDALPGTGIRSGSAFDTFVGLSTDALLSILGDCDTKTYRKPELIAEAASQLIISSFPILQATASPTAPLLPGAALKSKTGGELAHLVPPTTLEDASATGKLTTFSTLARTALQSWLVYPDLEIIAAAASAAVVLLLFTHPASARDATIRDWADAARARQSSKTRTTSGHFAALAAVYPVATALLRGAGDGEGDLICDAVVERWRGDPATDTRACIMQGLAGSELLRGRVGVLGGLVAEGLDDYTANARGDVGANVRYEAIRATRALWEGGLEEGGLVEGLFLRILRLAAEKLDRVRAQAQAALAVVLKPSQAALLRRSTFSSRAYFTFLLDLHQQDWLLPSVSATVKADPAAWMDALMAGLVSSADTGNEELVIAARAALCEFCERAPANRDAVCAALARNLKAWQGTDRVLVPTLEVVAFLFHVGIFARAAGVSYKGLCLQAQKACYKTGNVRKIEACVRVYGAVAELGRDADSGSGSGSGSADGETRKKMLDGAAEARARLAALLYHPWPRVRSMVVDELWGVFHDEPAAQGLRGVDWGRADKVRIKAVVGALGLA